MSNQSFGKVGECEAERYLKGLGYKILKRNFRTRFGEIDIVARDKECFVFVEVKTRTTEAYGRPEEAVTRTKQQHLIKAAQIYLSQTKQAHALWRIDVLALTVCHPDDQRGKSMPRTAIRGRDPRQNKNGGFEIRHLQNAVVG